MEKGYLKTLDNLQEIVVIEDNVGTIKYVNHAFCVFHGVEPEDAAGRSIFDFILPEDREACMMHNIVTPENDSYKIEGRSKRADGRVMWIQYVGKAFFSESGELLEFQEIGVDITRWKEKINEKTRALEKVNKALKESRLQVKDKRVSSAKDAVGNTALHTFADIITQSPKLKSLKIYAESVADGDCSILIEGESGTGKELFAQAIHNASRRANGPFVAVNCGAIPSELISSEFFGYEEGAFTGAAKGGKQGKFEMASGGTLFLDEIGEMPAAQQVALLRVLETRTVTRVGGSRVIPVDIRIICATNKNLLSENNEPVFRRDLYYRINIINLRIPPLRERKDDIFLLLGHFIKKSGSRAFEKGHAFTDQQLIKLYTYDWPGNVRELLNVIERMKFRPQETIDELIENSQADNITVEHDPAAGEKEKIINALNEFDHNVSMTARKLGISRNTLYKKLNKYGIKRAGQ